MTVSETETFITQHITTRQSSCVNARGIPTAAYQVLHLLSCTRWGTHLSGYPPPRPGPTGGTRGGVPPVRVPPQARSDRRGVPEVGYPPPGQTWLGYPPCLDLARVPPLRCEQTDNITFPRTTYAVGNDITSKQILYMIWIAYPCRIIR